MTHEDYTLLTLTLISLAKIVFLVFGFIMPLASLLTWAERRQSAMMQDRLGPNRANIGPFRFWGIPHFLADALKMLFKEDFMPTGAHKALFLLAPMLAMAPAIIVFAIIPFGPTIHFESLTTVLDPNAPLAGGIPLQIFAPEFGILFYFAIASLSNYGATLAGWASYNKWSLMGGLRASSQMMSYEVAMGLALIGVFLVTGTLQTNEIIAWQEQHTWGIVVQPLAFLLFFVAAIAETKRAPFDLPEGESEVIGYFTEYSGMRFGMFFLGEFIEIIFVSAILTTLFFGGYHFPGLHVDGFYWGGERLWAMPHGIVALLQIGVWGLKVVFFCWFQLLIRWTVPRFRPDQLMDLGWKKLLPASMLNVLVTSIGVLLWMRK